MTLLQVKYGTLNTEEMEQVISEHQNQQPWEKSALALQNQLFEIAGQS